LSITRKWGRIAFALVWLAIIASGCMGTSTVSTYGWTAVAADEDVVVGILPTGQVVALDPNANGQELWSFPATTTTTSSSPFSCSNNSTTTSDSQEVFEAVYGQPVLTDGLILFGSYDYSVYALDRDPAANAAARVKWSYATEGTVVGGVTVYEDVVYFGSADHKIYAVSLAEGKSLWEAPFSTENAVWGTPFVDDEHVYVGSMDHYVYALDRATGKQLWRTDVAGAVPASVTVADGVVFAASLDKRLHVLNAQDGSEVWASDDLGGWLMSQPVVSDGYVYVATLDGMLYGLDVKTGESRWPAITLGSAVRACPAWVDGNLLLATEAGVVVQVDIEAGTQTTLYTAAVSTLAEPAVVGDVVYISTTAGQVCALDASSASEPLLWLYPSTSEE